MAESVSVQKNGLRTYRPPLEKYVFDNDDIKKRITQWVEGVKGKRAARALLLTGPAGLGKTTLGLALCKALGAHDEDIREVNCASTRTLDDARDLISQIQYSPSFGDWKVLILDEVHQMVSNAQQAFLTPIEKLPDETILVACTSAPELLNEAFRSRFYEIRLSKYSDESIMEILEGLPTPPKAAEIATIVQVANGNPRKAIDMAEGGIGPADLQAQQVIQAMENFVPLLLAGEFPMLLHILNRIQYQEKQAFFEKVLGTLEHLWMFMSGNGDAIPLPDKKKIADFINKSKTPPNYASVTKYYRDLAQIQDKPISVIKAWVMTQAPAPAPKA